MEPKPEIEIVTRGIAVPAHDLIQAGHIANDVSIKHAQERYQRKSTENTGKRQKNDLLVFSRFLQTFLPEIDPKRKALALYSDMAEWQGVTHGLVETFLFWQEGEGYAIGSMNVRLATIKTYCKLACKAGFIPQTELGLILMVEGYSHKEGRNVDSKRTNSRLGNKKETATSMNAGHAVQLKRQPDTQEGRRDAFLMCLLLDHGLRVGEVAGLLRKGLDLDTGLLTFYREKVDKVQIHHLTGETLAAAMRYLPDTKNSLYLFPGYKGKAITARLLNSRVSILGKRIGLETLSPHDCRHYWATTAMRHGTDIKALQTAGGWNSPIMPLRYAEASKIANEGVKLS